MDEGGQVSSHKYHVEIDPWKTGRQVIWIEFKTQKGLETKKVRFIGERKEK